MSAITIYLSELRSKLASGVATEHTYRPALQDLLQGLVPGVKAHNEPKHTDAGAVDFILQKSEQPIGWLEAKDIGADLAKVAKSEQLKRYLGAYPNLVLTDYVNFKLYLGGVCKAEASLGVVDGAKLTSTADKQAQVEALLTNFLTQEVYRTGKPEDLAKRMAYLAHMAKDAITRALTQEGTRGQLHSQMDAFKDTLLPDLTEEQFADMYAQTIAYGLFAAKCNHPQGQPFDRWNAGKYLPPTNPFLRRLFHELTGPDLDEAVVWVVEELVSLLKWADMAEILSTFAKHQQGREDPVVHFYETFLKEYNPKERKIRGVYYTPEPVVSYIVRSVDQLLKTEFDKPLGLADPEVFILDPACGTGTFLYFVVEHIHQTITQQYGKDAWPAYVRENLLKRVFGFELLMAPYTIAHLKLGMQLAEQGYDFPDDQRLGIYLTNTLEEAKRRSETLVQRYITEESEAAAEVKRDKPIMVVLGNPPYAKHSANNGEWIRQLVHDYHFVDGKPLGERNPKWLQDDYVKFLRFGQWRIEQTGGGVLAFITNHGYLDNPTFRGMRQQLTRVFPHSSLLDLHGNTNRGEEAPDGSKDENVFDIMQGVSVGLFRRPNGASDRAIAHAELWGTRQTKYEVLMQTDVSTTQWTALEAGPPGYLLKPMRDDEVAREYRAGWLIPDVWSLYASTITTGRNEFLIAFDEATIRRRISDFVDTSVTTEELKREYEMGVIDLEAARQRVRKDSSWDSKLRAYAYRPFDTRYTFYSTDLTTRPRFEIMRHMLKPNLALLTHRPQSPKDFTYAFCCDLIADQCIAANKSGGGGNSYLLPLYEYPEEGTLEAHLPRRPNLNPAFTADLAARLGLAFIDDGQGDLAQTFGPEDVFHYIYAILHSPTYRSRYAEFLKTDFPRIPLTSDLHLFRRLCALGEELVALHLLKSPALAHSPAKFDGPGDRVVEAVRYDEANRKVFVNKTQGFTGISKQLFDFQVGGYKVMDKWLKDRKGRELSFADIDHYTKVASALTETMRLMREIDEAIPDWPIQ